MKNIILFLLLVAPSFLHAQVGLLSTVVGSGRTGNYSGDGGPATAANLGTGSAGLAIDAFGNIYYSARIDQVVRKIDTSGIITTIAGNGTRGYFGDGGAATAAQLNNPYLLALDLANNLLVCEVEGCRIRKISLGAGTISTFAGNGMRRESGDGGQATAASIHFGLGICIDNFGNVYFSTGVHQIKKVLATTGIISNYAGYDTLSGFTGDGGPATAANLSGPYDVCFDNRNSVYIADAGNNRIRRVDAASGIITTFAGGGTFSDSNGLAATATAVDPFCVVTDAVGNLFFSEPGGDRIRKLDIATGTISTIIGRLAGRGFSPDGSRVDTAKISIPSGIALDACDNLYFIDAGNYRIRKITYNTKPSIKVTSQGGNTLCYGMPVTFRAHTTLAGSAPVYQWRVNGVAVGGSAPTYTYTPANGDSIDCILTSNLYCVINPRDTSPALHLTVLGLAPPVVVLGGPPTAHVGDTVSVTATLSTGGSYTYTWQIGDSIHRTTGNTLTYVKTAGTDSIRVTLVSGSNRGCYDSVVSNVYVVTEAVGVAEVTAASPFSIWPNPFTNELHYSGLTAGGSLTLTDLAGRVVQTTALTGSIGTVTITPLPPGLYLLQLSDSQTGVRVWQRLRRE